MFTREHGTAGWSASILTLFSLSRSFESVFGSVLQQQETRSRISARIAKSCCSAWDSGWWIPLELHRCTPVNWRNTGVLKTAVSGNSKLPDALDRRKSCCQLGTLTINTAYVQSCCPPFGRNQFSVWLLRRTTANQKRFLSYIMLPKALWTTNGESNFPFLAIEVSNDSRTTQYLVGGSDLWVHDLHPESLEVKHDHPDNRRFLCLDSKHNCIVKVDTISR